MHSERRKIIKDMLYSKPFVSLKELIELFPDVSSMTIRRDIDYFEQQGEAIKVRGGARSMKFITTSMEEEFPSRMQKNVPAKEALAKKAIELIESRILKTVLEYLQNSGEAFRILIMPDHPTPLVTKTHSSEPVPFMIYDSTVSENGAETFTEKTALESGIFVEHGPSIMDKLLGKI